MDQVNPKNLIVGLDVGSTTVKSVVVDTSTDQIILSKANPLEDTMEMFARDRCEAKRV